MPDVTIYHNPRCSKSRQTLQLLRDQGVEPVIVEYLKHPLSEARIKQLLKMLDIEPRELLRKSEAEYRQLRLDDPKINPASLVKAMAAHPQLIERPIVVSGRRAALGRPPERVLEII
jgi:arsenate reductase